MWGGASNVGGVCGLGWASMWVRLVMWGGASNVGGVCGLGWASNVG